MGELGTGESAANRDDGGGAKKKRRTTTSEYVRMVGDLWFDDPVEDHRQAIMYELASFGRRGRQLSAARLESRSHRLLELLSGIPQDQPFNVHLVALRVEAALNAAIKGLSDPVDTEKRLQT